MKKLVRTKIYMQITSLKTKIKKHELLVAKLETVIRSMKIINQKFKIDLYKLEHQATQIDYVKRYKNVREKN